MAFDIPAQPAPAAIDLFIRQSGAQVVYIHNDVKDTRTNAVAGDYQPAAALDLLLKNTGLSSTESKGGQFTVGRIKPGSVDGSIRDEAGKPVAGAKVSLADSDQSVLSDKRGRFAFAEVAAGAYVLLIAADGMQNTRVTDVTVNAGRELSLSSITIPVKKEGTLELDTYTVSAKKNDGVFELEPYEVQGTKEKPFSGVNVDIPRTINDAQPYYVFDAKTIDASGATNVEDFLKQRLTMNATALTNSQNAGDGNVYGAGSTVDLRGLGADKTLVLINGRRITGAFVSKFSGSLPSQPDLNGIPLSAIDRIEVLPSSSSGIYGGSAIGGVVNVILKKEYRGGEIRAIYENTWNTDSPRRTLAASYGMTLEGGRTHVLLSGQWSDSEPLRFGDRRGLYEQNLAIILRNRPTLIHSAFASVPPLGSVPNITSTAFFNQTTFVFTPDPGTLTLRDGTPLGYRRTHIPVGTTASTSSGSLRASLLANAGTYDMGLPASPQPNTGLLRPMGVASEVKSLQATIRRQMRPSLEAFLEFSYAENDAEAVNSPFSGAFVVQSSAPTNPFRENVAIRIPSITSIPIINHSVTRAISGGMKAQLPWDWTAQADYTWSENRHTNADAAGTLDNTALRTDLDSGALNPFVDTLLTQLDLSKYVLPKRYSGSTELHDFALRTSGPLDVLPWGIANLTTGLEYRIAKTPEHTYAQLHSNPASRINDRIDTLFAREQDTKSAYGELDLPLVAMDRIPGIHELSLQVAGRTERYTVDTGTPGKITWTSRTPVEVVFNSPVTGTGANARPFFSKDSYTSNNYTLGLKYRPVPSVTLRGSAATAFLPPLPAQLVSNPDINPTGAFINSDPRDPTFATNNPFGANIPAITGGNPNLKPQNSKSRNIGLIWEPQLTALRGLRLNAEFYRIEQLNAISTLTGQQIVDNEAAFPDRVTRDASNRITRLDVTALNLFHRETEGWDLNLSYSTKTPWGTFDFSAAQTVILTLKEQFASNQPEYDAAGYSPAESGVPKYKGSASLVWEHRNWSAGWTTAYIDSYKQFGAAGGPRSRRFSNGGVNDVYVAAQGSDMIGSQVYHDLFVGYAFDVDSTRDGLRSAFLSGLRVRLGVKNVFNTVPPFDAFYVLNFYQSPYGDSRLRSYLISVSKQF